MLLWNYYLNGLIMTLHYLISKLKGGSGSGHWGHAGRIGKHGGSVSGGGLSGLGLDKSSTVEERRALSQAARSTGKYKIMTDTELTDYYNWDKLKTENADSHIYVNRYTGNAYGFVNGQLRGTAHYPSMSDTINDYITHIDRMINNAPRTPENMKVFRQVFKNDKEFIKRLKPGTVFQDDGYTSTSIDPIESRNFIGSGGVTIEIRVPKGSKGLYVHPISANKHLNEYELLLPRGGKYKILKNNGREIVAEMFPEV